MHIRHRESQYYMSEQAQKKRQQKAVRFILRMAEVDKTKIEIRNVLKKLGLEK